MKKKLLFIFVLLLTACATPVAEPTATSVPVILPTATFTSTPTLTVVQTLLPTQTPIPTSPPDFCADIRGTDLIKTFTQAIVDKDGALLASLISPANGVNINYYRNGNVINYDNQQAKFLFETTYQADWGLSFGSGEPTFGSFQEIIVPSLKRVLASNSLVVCNQIQTGGVTYFPEWEYVGMNYYSVYFVGTEGNGYFDWETWAIGMDDVAGKPYIAALAHYVWEP